MLLPLCGPNQHLYGEWCRLFVIDRGFESVSKELSINNILRGSSSTILLSCLRTNTHVRQQQYNIKVHTLLAPDVTAGWLALANKQTGII